MPASPVAHATTIAARIPTFPDDPLPAPVTASVPMPNSGDSLLPAYAHEYLSGYILEHAERVAIFRVCPYTPSTVARFIQFFPAAELRKQAGRLETALRQWQRAFVARHDRRPGARDKAAVQAQLVLYHLVCACLEAWAALRIQAAARGWAARRSASALRLERGVPSAAAEAASVAGVDFARNPLGSVYALYAGERADAVPLDGATVAHLTSEAAATEKTFMKLALRQFDCWYEDTHHRPADKAVKEALRPAYRVYRALKARAAGGAPAGSTGDGTDTEAPSRGSSPCPPPGPGCFTAAEAMDPLEGALWILEQGRVADPCHCGLDVLARRRRSTNRVLRRLKALYSEGIAQPDRAERRVQLAEMADVYYSLIDVYEKMKTALGGR